MYKFEVIHEIISFFNEIKLSKFDGEYLLNKYSSNLIGIDDLVPLPEHIKSMISELQG